MSCNVPPMTTTLVTTPMISATCCLHGVPPTRKLVLRSWLVVPALLRSPARGQPQVAERGPEAVDDRGQGLHQVDDAARGHRSRADVPDVPIPDVRRQHLVDGDRARIERGGTSLSEKRDGG